MMAPWWMLLALVAAAAGEGHATVELRVRLPESTPAGAVVHLAGDAPGLGGWRPDGLRLGRVAPGLARGVVVLPRGTWAYKATLGTWGTVERTASGRDVPNRTLEVTGPAVVEIRVEAWSVGEGEPRRSTATGTIRVHEDFTSRHLGPARRVTVWLPPGYDGGAERYPALYLQDGQNVFDAARAAFGDEWEADETAARLIAAGRIPAVILVAIDNAPERLAEYTPTADAMGRGGRAAAYARFLAEELKPFIDATYRTRPGAMETAVCGSSLGGLAALETARRHPDQFGLCAALSPSAWWDDERLARDLEVPGAWPGSARLWIDIGTAEGRDPEASLAAARRLREALQAAGLAPGPRFSYREYPGARHDERAWAARLGEVLEFLFPAR